MIKVVLMKALDNTWPMIIVFLITMCIVRYFYLKYHREKFVLYKECLFIFGVIYIWLLFELLTKTELNNSGGYNIIPFEEILRYDINSPYFLLNVVGNILIFIPFGYLICEYIKPKKFYPIFIISLITSITVEFIQLNIGRSFDVDDIILNVLGSSLGYLIFICLKKIQKLLPDIFKKEIIYNIICLIIIILLIIYICGYWKVIF